MGIKMNTYAGGQMTAGNDAILHDRVIANTGILHGVQYYIHGANQIHIEKRLSADQRTLLHGDRRHDPGSNEQFRDGIARKAVCAG